MDNMVVRLATPGDLPDFRSAIVEVQEHERELLVDRKLVSRYPSIRFRR